MAKNIADNPARRLHDILQQCKQIPNGQPCRASWQKILKTEDERELLVRLGKLIELTRETVSVIEEAFPHHVQPILGLRQQVSTGVAAQNLNGQWATFVDKVDSSSLMALSFAASLHWWRYVGSCVGWLGGRKGTRRVRNAVAYDIRGTWGRWRDTSSYLSGGTEMRR